MIQVLAWCDHNGGTIRLVFLVLLVLSGTMLLASCGSARPAAPATAIIGSALLPAGSATADKETHYRGEVERLTMALEQAKAGLKVAQADAVEVELKTWRTWTRWIGLIGITVAVALGGTLSWLIGPRVGIPVSAILAGTALAVLGFGAALRWLPAALGVVSFGGMAAWAIYHYRARQALDATARLSDSIESTATSMIPDINLHAFKEQLRLTSLAPKIKARIAQERAGLHRFVQKARGKDEALK